MKLKTVNPVVFDDPENCKSDNKECQFLNAFYCDLFRCVVSVWDEKYCDHFYLKCQECKDHYQKNKYPISGSKSIADATKRIKHSIT